jgi:hypothetical protein
MEGGRKCPGEDTRNPSTFGRGTAVRAALPRAARSAGVIEIPASEEARRG